MNCQVKITKKISLFFVTLLLLLLFTPIGLLAKDSIYDITYTQGADYDGYIIKLKDNATLKFDKSSGISQISEGRSYFYAETLDEVKNSIPENSIQYIEPDYIMYFDENLQTTNFMDDPYLPNQWGLDMTRGFAVWSSGLSASNAVVGVIDTGLYTAHEDIDSSFVEIGKNLLTNTTDTTDVVGHGTMVTSVIAATNNNNKGISSLGYTASIVPLKVSDSRYINTRDAMDAIYEAVDTYDCDVVNMSFGGPAYEQAFNDVCDYAASQNVLLIAASGNTSDSVMQYPAGYDSVIGVGAITIDGVKADYSTYNSSVYVTAPGSNIYMARNTGVSAYGYASGTSFAAPYVVSFAALAKSYDGSMTPSEFKTLLNNSSVDKGASGYDTSYGYGVVDAGLFVYNLTNSDYFDFNDVSTGSLYYPYIAYGVRYGYFRGTSENTFSPDVNINRADMVTLLGRLYEMRGGSIPNENDSFIDTVDGSYYSKYVAWANNAGIVNGTGGNCFSPGVLVTREMIATLVYRYAQYTGISIGTVDLNVLNQFSDRNQISAYAETPMAWMVQQGMLNGTSATTLSPRGYGPRKQVAKILYSYCQSYASF